MCLLLSLTLCQGYIGPRDDGAVKLNKLNSMEWTKTRNKVKSAVKDMAEELTKLYAQRQMAKGFAFSPDNDWQADFEERFDYQETDEPVKIYTRDKVGYGKAVPNGQTSLRRCWLRQNGGGTPCGVQVYAR